MADSCAPQNHSEGFFLISDKHSIENINRESYQLKNLLIPIRMRNRPSNYLYFPLDTALSLLFPLLFPFGKLPEIPGKTLRSKAQVPYNHIH
jgi:hypothetical protein